MSEHQILVQAAIASARALFCDCSVPMATTLDSLETLKEEVVECIQALKSDKKHGGHVS